MKIKITKEMLEGEGSRLLATGLTTDKKINFYGWGDEKRPLKFVICKGFINDWCIYLENMEFHQSYEQIQSVGNKISPATAQRLIDCSEEVLKRYRI